MRIVSHKFLLSGLKKISSERGGITWRLDIEVRKEPNKEIQPSVK